MFINENIIDTDVSFHGSTIFLSITYPVISYKMQLLHTKLTNIVPL